MGMNVNYIPNESLSFPMQDSENIIKLNFLGLYGADGRLSHDLLWKACRDPVYREFLNIFNTKIYDLYHEVIYKYASILKNAYYYNVIESKRTKTAADLYDRLNYLADKVTIQTQVPQWVPVVSGVKLGDDMVLGSYLIDLSAKIAVSFEFLNYDDYVKFKKQINIKLIIKKFIGHSARADIFIKIIPPHYEPLAVGTSPVMLGELSWVGALLEGSLISLML